MAKKHLATGVLLTAFAFALGVNAEENQTEAAPENTTTARQQSAGAGHDANTMRYANHFHLAYFSAASISTDQTSETGLLALANALKEKTTIEPAGVARLDPDNDDLSLFSFIYWPITDNTRPLSIQAQRNIQNYLNSGGMILIDLINRDQNKLREVVGGLNIKQLVPFSKNHTLAKSHYLIDDLQGSNNFGRNWVEIGDDLNKENVSTVIIGERNWAAAWASTTLSEETGEHEQAIRSGINMISYALTGNYKSDHAHKKTIEKRLEP